jgi:ribosomal protein L37AE/L43A
MTLSIHDTVNARLVAYNRNSCPQCGAWLLAPEWSEYRNERCVRHIWTCEACSYSFETDVFFAKAA